MQKKWKSIRGCFTREINRQKNLKSGSAGGRKSEYLYFQQLQFLKNTVLIREPDPVTTSAEPAENSQGNKEVVNPAKRIKTKENTDDDKFVAAINKSIESREKHDALKEDEDHLFMLSLVETLKRVHPQRKMATKIKIMSILDEATRTNYYNTETPGPSNQAYSQSFWSQNPEPQPRIYHPGYSTCNRSSDNLPMDDNPVSPIQSPPSNNTNYSEESSILDLF